MKLVPLALGVILLGSVSWADAATDISTPPANDPNLRIVNNPDPVEPPPATFQIAVAWNAKAKEGLSVPLKNDSADMWQVLGVQSSAGIYIQDFPNKIKSGESGEIDFIYDSREDTDAAVELIRVKTDNGVKTVSVQIQREAAVAFDTHEVHWKVGDPLAAKSITVTVSAGTVIPQNLKTSNGANATLEPIDSTHYRISITPKSTAKTDHFQVAVKFDKGLPGVSTKIYGSIDD